MAVREVPSPHYLGGFRVLTFEGFRVLEGFGEFEDWRRGFEGLRVQGLEMLGIEGFSFSVAGSGYNRVWGVGLRGFWGLRV